MIRLDTHVVVWLYTGEVEKLSPAAVKAIEDELPAISPLVGLELTYLHEIGRLTVTAAEILDDLAQRISLATSQALLANVVKTATALRWTRDPFDRLIAADALCVGASLVTKDSIIRANLETALW